MLRQSDACAVSSTKSPPKHVSTMPFSWLAFDDEPTEFKLICQVMNEWDLGWNGAELYCDMIKDAFQEHDCIQTVHAIKVASDERPIAVIYMHCHWEESLALVKALHGLCDSFRIGFSDIAASPIVARLDKKTHKWKETGALRPYVQLSNDAKSDESSDDVTEIVMTWWENLV